METKDIVSIFSVLVALVLGVYNVWRTRKVSYTVDSLLLDDKRFEVLKTAIDIQTLRTKERTIVEKSLYEMRALMIGLSPADKSEAQKSIDIMAKQRDDLNEDIATDIKIITQARELTAPTEPDAALIQKVNKLLGLTKERQSEALLQQAMTDEIISAAKNLIASAQLHTNSVRSLADGMSTHKLER